MAKVGIDLDLLVRISEIAASALNDTVSHKVVKSETNATDGDIEAAFRTSKSTGLNRWL